jgi:hypothetical protein
MFGSAAAPRDDQRCRRDCIWIGTWLSGLRSGETILLLLAPTITAYLLKDGRPDVRPQQRSVGSEVL